MTDSQQNPRLPAVYTEDEISLYDLYRILTRRFKLILLVLISVVIVSSVYVLLTPRVYQASAQIRVPLASEVYLTNIFIPIDKIESDTPRQGELRISSTHRHGELRISSTPRQSKLRQSELQITNPSPEQVFMDYLRALTSNAQWQLFRTAKGFLSHEQKQELPSTNPISVKSKNDSKKDSSAITYDNATITYRTNSTTAGEAKALQAYLDFTQRTLANELRKQLSAYLTHERDTLELELQIAEDIQRKIAERRTDKLAKEVALAKKLHVLQNLRVQFNDQVNSTTLENQRRLALLKRITILHTGFHAYRLDGNIVNPVTPVKPRTKLILSLAAVLGLFLGIFAAFISEFISRVREEAAQNA